MARFATGGIPPCPEWRDARAVRAYRTDKHTSLFALSQPLRRMVAVVSAEVLDEKDRHTELLLGLLTHPSIRLLRYSDDGPPATAEVRDTFVGPVVEGWITHLPPQDDYSAGVVVTLDGESATGSVAGSRDALELLERFGNPVYGDSLEDEQEQRRRDAIAAFAAEAVGADLLITRRRLLFEPPFPIAAGVAVLQPEAALPVIGLYLRSQGKFIVWRNVDGNVTSSVNRGLFYWEAVRGVVPDGYRWMLASSVVNHESDLIWLVQSLHQRVGRALRARDRIHCALLLPQNNDTAEEALTELDVLLVCLMGAFDAAARVAHLAFQLRPNRLPDAAWHKEPWLKLWSLRASDLFDYIRPGAVACCVYTVVRLLRNTVHGVALQPIGITSEMGRRRDDTLVGLPRGDRQSLVEALNRLGGPEVWGVRDLGIGRSYADIRVLVERLFPAAVAVLNGLLRLIPAECFGANLSAEGLLPSNTDVCPTDEERRDLIRLQLGLPETL